MSTLKVNTIESETPNVTIADGLTVTGVGTVTTLNTTNLINATQLSNRNMIINGAMRVAQRGTSSTTSGYGSVDRFQHTHNGTDEAPTFEQADVASGTTPYTLGFRKSLKVTNGNQTSGAGASDYIYISQRIESQNTANSGWNYTSTSSFITLSFWVKSSVAQEFHGFILSADGTRKLYSFSLGSLSANTWTKVTKTIPGTSDLQFDNDNAQGILFRVAMFRGTDATGTITQNQWGTFDTNVRYPNYTSTWYTTNDATFELTGVQLEVGSVATPFEHRSYGDELQLCKRYYYDMTTSNSAYSTLVIHQNGYFQHPQIKHPVEMRAAPTITFSNVARRALNGSGDTSESISNTTSAKTSWTSYPTNTSNTFQTFIYDYPIKFDSEL